MLPERLLPPKRTFPSRLGEPDVPPAAHRFERFPCAVIPAPRVPGRAHGSAGIWSTAATRAVALPENGRLLEAEFGDRVELIEIDGAGHALLPEKPTPLPTPC